MNRSQIDEVKVTVASIALALVICAAVALLIGGVFIMQEAGQNAVQAWLGLGMVAAGMAGGCALGRLLPRG